MIAVVTGASSGFGFHVCRMLKEKGWTVYGLSRREAAPAGVTALSVDLGSREETEAAFRFILEKEGQVDLLVNNAGMGQIGPLEGVSPESAETILRVNMLGALTCTQLVLPGMRARRSGTIVFVSSAAAEIPMPYQAMYSATKAALTSLALALRSEVAGFGIRVTAVEPGDARTGFTDARKGERSLSSVYSGNEAVIRTVEQDERGGMPAEYVAGRIVSAALAADPKPVYVVNGKYRLLTLLYHLLPLRLSCRIVGKLYS